MIGFTPAEVNRMSLWELGCVVTGYVNANTPDDPKEVSYPTDEEYRNALRWLN